MMKTSIGADGSVQHNGNPESTAQAVRHGLETAKDKVVEGYDMVSKKAHDAWDNVSDKNINDVSLSVQQYVRRHPGTSLMLAVGTGLILGFVFRSRWS